MSETLPSNLRTKISEAIFMMKFVMLPLWVSMFGIVTFCSFAGTLRMPDNEAPPEFVKWLCLGFWLSGSAFIGWGIAHFKRVRDDEPGLYISNGSMGISTPSTAIGRGTDVGTRCSVYPSKSYALMMLAILLGFGALTGLFRPVMPGFVQVFFAILVGTGIMGVLYSLLSRKLVLSVDETGIVYFPRWYPKFEWQDVVGVERMSRVEQETDGSIGSCVSDSWRPIRVVVRGREKYLQRIPKIMQFGLLSCEEPDCLNVMIEFAGLDTGSAKVFECIRTYLGDPVASTPTNAL